MGDHWNPILVKEVRAALRGRVFRIVFPIVVLGAVVVAMMRLSSLDPARDADVGRQFVEPIYVMLCITILGIVPFSAFFSMGGEWEEHTFDLLSISNLRPRHIVFGKLFSAGVETTLYFSAFAPLLVFAFLLRGLDLVALLSLLAVTYVASFATAAVALALSSLARVRIARILVLCVVAAMCFGVIVGAYAFGEEWVFTTWAGPRSLGWRGTLWSLVVLFGFMFGATTVACERLAHPEENHSTGPRVLVTALFAAWIISMVFLMRRPASMSLDWIAEPVMAGLALSAFAHIFFVTEREDMTRRAAHDVPRTKISAVLAAPLLPGGGRGLLLFALHSLFAIVVVVCVVTSRSLASFDEAAAGRETLRVFSFAAHLFVYLGMISWFSHKRADKPVVRWVTRLAIPAFVLLAVCVPAFSFYLLGERSYPEFEHSFNPFMSLARNSLLPSGQRTAIMIAALVVVLLNMPRVVRAVREVVRHCSENRTRARGS